jgi:hypothetical protein
LAHGRTSKSSDDAPKPLKFTDGAGSLIDLSGINVADFAFPDVSGGPHFLRIHALNGGAIDLRNVASLTAPAARLISAGGPVQRLCRRQSAIESATDQ